MTNAVKHGRAEAIHVELTFRSTGLTLRIKDDGSGFDPAQHLEQASGCFGLLGMRERTRELRGELQIQSQPGQGTEVIVTAPTAEPEITVRQTSPTNSAGALPMRSRAV